LGSQLKTTEKNIEHHGKSDETNEKSMNTLKNPIKKKHK
jgi:hypothetical protein